jgi:hypothetical protein
MGIINGEDLSSIKLDKTQIDYLYKKTSYILNVPSEKIQLERTREVLNDI